MNRSLCSFVFLFMVLSHLPIVHAAFVITVVGQTDAQVITYSSRILDRLALAKKEGVTLQTPEPTAPVAPTNVAADSHGTGQRPVTTVSRKWLVIILGLALLAAGGFAFTHLPVRKRPVDFPFSYGDEERPRRVRYKPLKTKRPPLRRHNSMDFPFMDVELVEKRRRR